MCASVCLSETENVEKLLVAMTQAGQTSYSGVVVSRLQTILVLARLGCTAERRVELSSMSASGPAVFRILLSTNIQCESPSSSQLADGVSPPRVLNCLAASNEDEDHRGSTWQELVRTIASGTLMIPKLQACAFFVSPIV